MASKTGVAEAGRQVERVLRPMEDLALWEALGRTSLSIWQLYLAAEDHPGQGAERKPGPQDLAALGIRNALAALADTLDGIEPASPGDRDVLAAMVEKARDELRRIVREFDLSLGSRGRIDATRGGNR